MADRKMSLMEVAVRNAGVVGGARACEFVVAWAIAEHQLGRQLGDGIRREGLSAAMSDYAAYWKVSERTAWRELSRFHAAFGTDVQPHDVARLVVDAAHDRQSARAALTSTPYVLA